MREIKFRGKRVDNGDWIFGYLESQREIRGYYVNPETVGQLIGPIDKKGKEIYEGDIVKRIVLNNSWDEIDNPKVEKFVEEISFIEYIQNGFGVNSEYFGWEGEGLWNWDSIEVVGNIHDNPELLK